MVGSPEYDESLQATIVMLRKNGVLEFEHNGLKLKLAPELPTYTAQNSTASVDPRCKCDHSLATEHNDQGLCLHGCDVEVCHPAS